MNTNATAVTKSDVAACSAHFPIQLENGWTALVRTERDDDYGPPWEEHDGHGEVSAWRSYDPRNEDGGKRAGERVLCQDGRSARFYDFAAAIVTARKDDWGCGDDTHAHVTAGQRAACAVERDFEFLRGWATDQWEWITIIATLFDADGEEVASDSLSGVESFGDYWQEEGARMVNELAEGIAAPTHCAAAV
jgi:hypothetical protein